jgi:hypothetical protein
MSIRVSSNAQIAESEDGSYLDVTIENHLPCVSNFHLVFNKYLVMLQDLPVDQVTVVLAGRDKERLSFSASTQRLLAGLTSLRLFCAVGVLMFGFLSIMLLPD